MNKRKVLGNLTKIIINLIQPNHPKNKILANKNVCQILQQKTSKNYCVSIYRKYKEIKSSLL